MDLIPLGQFLMKLLKNIALSLFIVTSSAGVAFAGIAEDIDNVSTKITEASKAIDDGSSSKDIILIIREAAELVKKIPQGDNIDVKRQRANAYLKKARLSAKKEKLEDSKKHLEKATKGFASLRAQF